MKRVISLGTSDRLEARNCNIKGLSFALVLTGLTDNTDFVPATLDFDAIRVDAVLMQHGRRTTVISGTLGVLSMESNFHNGLFKHASLTRAADELRAKDTTVKPICQYSFAIDFGTVINLDGDDLLIVDINAPTSVTATEATTKADSAASSIEVKTVEGIGAQIKTPSIKQYGIQASLTSYDQNLGSGVETVTFINKDKNTKLTSDNVITTASIYSDRYSDTLDMNDLYVERAKKFEVAAEAPLRYNSFQLLNRLVNNCKINLGFTSANVTASKNYLVVRYAEFYVDTVNKGINMTEKHKAADLSDVKPA